MAPEGSVFVDKIPFEADLLHVNNSPSAAHTPVCCRWRSVDVYKYFFHSFFNKPVQVCTSLYRLVQMYNILMQI